MITDGLPEGLIAVVKRDCRTCVLIQPVLEQLEEAGLLRAVYSQDDPNFPINLDRVVDDSELAVSYRLGIEIVPTLIHVRKGREVKRIEGWVRDEWRALSGLKGLGMDLPSFRPGCGSRSQEPGVKEQLRLRFESGRLQSRRVVIGTLEDEIEAVYERGWSDGLPPVPPTPARVLAMLDGTPRPPQEIVAVIPPDLVPCTVEKVAVNAVMAGCKPEYMPVLLAALEAACVDEFCLHGLLASTYPVAPVVIVSGPITHQIGMNSGINVLGQGNRANATIGRALQLIVQNVGGGRPGGVDRAALGHPGKYTFCFAEDDLSSPWESLSEERGFGKCASTVTLFAGEAPRAVFDQTSRSPEELARSLAAALESVAHPKLYAHPQARLKVDAVLVVPPAHARIFREAGWTKARLEQELQQLLLRPGAQLIVGAGGIGEGLPTQLSVETAPKFRPGGLLIVHCGGPAGAFSAIIGGWPNSGPSGSQPVTKEIVI